MPNDIVTNFSIGDPTGASSEQYDLGVEAQNVIVSYDANGHVIEDITSETVVSTKPLSSLLKGSAGNYYGTCDTTASTAAKIITVDTSQNFELKTGVFIGVAFDNTNIAANPTINVNNTGAISIFKGNAVQTSGDAGIMGGYTSFFQYNGTYWVWISFGASSGAGGGHVILNQNGSEMTQRSDLQFTGYLKTTDDSTNEKTVVSDSPTPVTWADWQEMTAAQKEGTKWLITDVPGDEGSEIVHLTQAEYDALPDSKLSDNKLYLITDGEGPTPPTPVVPDGKTVTPTNDVEIWLKCAGLFDTGYTTLSEVLADTGILRVVLNDNNATDYLVRSKSFAKSEALVPTMTSDTTPEGECFGYGTRTSAGYYNYLPFSGDESAGWMGNVANNYVGYKFPSSVKIGSYSMAYNHYSQNTATFPQADFTVQASSDGINYDIFDTYSSSSPDTSVIKRTHTGSFTNVADKRYFKIQLAQSGYGTESGNNFVRILSIQFYSPAGLTNNATAMSYIGANDYTANTLLADNDWNEAIQNSQYFESVDNVKVPTMTSNTTPSGNCYGSPAAASGFEFYKAFDGNNSTYYSGGTDIKPDDFLGYNFQRNVNCRKVYIRGNQLVYPSNTTIKIVGVKNEGGSFVDHDIKTNIPHTTGDQIIILDNPDTYVAYKFVVTSGTGSGGTQVFATYECQFYGRQNGGVQTWLRSADITDKSYTTLSQVLSDSSTLSTLMASEDAVDYLVTCKGWATEICSNQSAMSYIGLNNYAADTLLADSTWCSAICNSTYFESVLNVKVPVMTSNTAPSGVVTSSAKASYQANAYRCFGGSGSDISIDSKTAYSSWIQYQFENPVKIYKFKLAVGSNCNMSGTFSFTGDGNTIYTGGTFASGNIQKEGIMTDNNLYSAFKLTISNTQQGSDSYKYTVISELQFYGRVDV